MMRRWTIALLSVLTMSMAVQARSDVDAPEDTVGTKAYRILFNFDFRRTFVNAEPVRFYGFRIGAQRGMDIVALGFYGLGDPYLRKDVELEGLGPRDLNTNFDYVCLTYERLLRDVRRWQVGVPLSIGLGNYNTSYMDSAGVFRAWSTNELVPLEASLHVDYNVTWWAFIGVGGGYRHVLAADRDITISLSDWTYYFKVGLRFGEIVKRARKEIRRDDDT